MAIAKYSANGTSLALPNIWRYIFFRALPLLNNFINLRDYTYNFCLKIQQKSSSCKYILEHQQSVGIMRPVFWGKQPQQRLQVKVNALISLEREGEDLLYVHVFWSNGQVPLLSILRIPWKPWLSWENFFNSGLKKRGNIYFERYVFIWKHCRSS